MADDSRIYSGREAAGSTARSLGGAGANDISSVTPSTARRGPDLLRLRATTSSPCRPSPTRSFPSSCHYERCADAVKDLTSTHRAADDNPRQRPGELRHSTPKIMKPASYRTDYFRRQGCQRRLSLFETKASLMTTRSTKDSVDGQVVKGPSAADLKEGAGPFVLGPNQTARVTLVLRRSGLR